MPKQYPLSLSAKLLQKNQVFNYEKISLIPFSFIFRSKESESIKRVNTSHWHWEVFFFISFQANHHRHKNDIFIRPKNKCKKGNLCFHFLPSVFNSCSSNSFFIIPLTVRILKRRTSCSFYLFYTSKETAVPIFQHFEKNIVPCQFNCYIGVFCN